MSAVLGYLKSFFQPPPPASPEEMARVKALVDNLIASNPIAVFSKSYCPYCSRAKSILSSLPQVDADGSGKEGKLGMKVLELDHEKDGPAIQAAVAERVGSSRVTVPQIFIRQQHVGGSDDLLKSQRNGQLERLLASQ